MFSFMRRNTPEISVDDLAEVVRERSAHVIDVREDWEFRRGHVAGAVNMPLGLLRQRVGELPRDRRCVVICESGGRSLGATDFLLAQGLEGAVSVRGGTNAWARTGHPLER